MICPNNFVERTDIEGADRAWLIGNKHFYHHCFIKLRTFVLIKKGTKNEIASAISLLTNFAF